MIRLNLLPPKVRAAERLRKILVAAVAAYAVAGGWLFWQWSVNHAQLVEERRDLQRVQAQLNSPELQVAVQAVKKFADDMAAMKAEASVVNALRQQQVPLLKVLDRAPDWCMNGQVWFTSLEVDPGNGGQKVTLGGEVRTRSQFAQYYDYLGALPDVQGLTLSGEPVLGMFSGVRLLNFSVAFSVGDQP